MGFITWAQVQGFVDEQGEVEALLLVFRNQLPKFSPFLDFVYAFEESLSEVGAGALVQLARFTPTTSSTAVAGYPDVEGIPDRNMERI